MAGAFLRAFKPIARFLPEVAMPKRRVALMEKLFWTFLALTIYFIMSEIPLYLPGMAREAYWERAYMRVIFASHHGTLMELGIGPIVTAGLIVQLLVGSGMVQCDMSNPEDRSLFTSASKAFSIIFTGVQASAYIFGGVYGRLDIDVAMMVFLQLLTAGVIVILLDEFVQKWGIGSGISLFILAGVAQAIALECFNPLPIEPGRAHGAFVAIVQTLMAGGNVWELFLRPHGSLLGLIMTVAVFLVVIYLEGIRVELPISHASYKGFRARYPIKLLYVSVLPVIFASALFANVYLFSQLLWSWNGAPAPGDNWWLDLIGQFKWEGNQPRPVGGLVYYVTAPLNVLEVLSEPLRALGYALALVAFCALFSITWLEVGGMGPSAVAKQLIDSKMQIPGYRRSTAPVEALLKRYLPVVAILGGIIIGLIAAIADFLGVFGTGTGILLSVGIIYQYYQLLTREQVAEVHPAIRKFLGE